MSQIPLSWYAPSTIGIENRRARGKRCYIKLGTLPGSRAYVRGEIKKGCRVEIRENCIPWTKWESAYVNEVRPDRVFLSR